MFNFKLNYNTVNHSGTKLYNGNISETEWRTKNTDQSLKWYRYSYDALNRTIGALSDAGGKYNLGGYDASGNLVSPITYDKNGNIKNLIRKGHLDNTTTPAFGVMDNLVYDYGTANGNKLLKVTDTSVAPMGVKGQFQDKNTSGNDYSYDANENMVKDLNKGIGTISINGVTYNHLNLPLEVKFNNSNTKKINYVYDASGTKLRKTVAEILLLQNMQVINVSST